MLRLVEAFFERRKGRLGGGELRPDCQNIRVRDCSGFDLIFRGLELFLLETDDLFGGFDLRSIGSPGDAGVDYIADKSETGRPGGLHLIVNLCAQVLYCAALSSEYVQSVINCAVKRVEVKNGTAQR